MKQKNKYCKICNTGLTPNNWYKSYKKYSIYKCVTCENIRNTKYKDIWNKNRREKNRTLKLQIIHEYGGKCVCCGITQIEFLTIDHIYGGGNKERREAGKGMCALYRQLIAQNFPKDRYQLLCFNCNIAKGFFGKCPHITERNEN